MVLHLSKEGAPPGGHAAQELLSPHTGSQSQQGPCPSASRPKAKWGFSCSCWSSMSMGRLWNGPGISGGARWDLDVGAQRGPVGAQATQESALGLRPEGRLLAPGRQDDTLAHHRAGGVCPSTQQCFCPWRSLSTWRVTSTAQMQRASWGSPSITGSALRLHLHSPALQPFPASSRHSNTGIRSSM
ncbi:hypothetical protein mRhiFer1_009325 [Rhinolophus ferrumequinum]|uniref:Uncharacterized protein n=1 Tax=Rhinolophus ferrumequinum TaxID=59479 RepID=A0A7J7RXM4_RHIFE|nr:hypothetical protein mRhiFer1_009325 [Rhinolophus ferrumequinum]